MPLLTLTIQPSPALDHARQDGLRQVERRFYVDLERDRPTSGRVAAQRGVHRSSCIVDEDVERPADFDFGARNDTRP